MLETVDRHRDFVLLLEKNEMRLPARNLKISVVSVSGCSFLIYRPKNLGHPPHPTVLHIRGTGYTCSANYYAYLMSSHLAEKSACQVIEIQHRLAPEYPCPVGFNDVYASYTTIIHNAEVLKIAIDTIAICGYSSGGNFAALTAIKARKDQLPVHVQVLISPVTDLSRSLKQFESYEDKDSFTDHLVRWLLGLYIAHGEDPQDAAISPYWSNALEGLPPTYFLFGEEDRFRSDSVAYADKLSEAGVWVHQSLFAAGQHVMYWRDITVVETVSIQLRLSFGLQPIPRPLSLMFFQLEKKAACLPEQDCCFLPRYLVPGYH